MIDSTGAVWSPAAGWFDDARRITTLANQPIGGTIDPILYQNSQWGMRWWSMPVPAPGEYRVQMHFVEGYWTAPGKRVTDISAEGRVVLDDVDIFKEAGWRKALVREFTTRVEDGRLSLYFSPVVDNPTVSAISITQVLPEVPAPSSTATPEATPSTTPSPSPSASTETPTAAPTSSPSADTSPVVFESRMVARPDPVTDSQGRVWSRWSATLGSWNRSTKLAGQDVSGTDDDELYRFNVWNARGYQLKVPAVATYRVRLLMAEDSFWSPGKRVFDVRAENNLVAAGVDINKAVGTRAAHDLIFDVPVSDGRLDLTFSASADVPLISAIEVVSTTAVAPMSDDPVREVGLAPSSFFTQDISSAPLRDDSSALATALAARVASQYGGISAFNAYTYNVGFHRVPAGTPTRKVEYACSTDGLIPPGLHDGPGYFLDVPVPDDAIPAPGADGEMTIYDPATDRIWEFWQMRRDSTTGRWSACWGGRIDEVSNNQGIFPSGFGASASGLLVAPGMVSLDDVRRGRIDHALALSVPEPKKGEFYWPANRTDGTSASATAIPEGQRLRLDPTLNLDDYALTPLGRVIAEAAQRYGFVVSDHGGAVALAGESGEGEKAKTGVQPWDAMIGGNSWDVMRNFPWDRVQFLTPGYGQP